MSEHLLTSDQLAEKLSAPKTWVYEQTKQTGPDAIPRLKVGKYLRFRENEVMAWLKKQNKDR